MPQPVRLSTEPSEPDESRHRWSDTPLNDRKRKVPAGKAKSQPSDSEALNPVRRLSIWRRDRGRELFPLLTYGNLAFA
jgi:hypothetical protein